MKIPESPPDVWHLLEDDGGPETLRKLLHVGTVDAKGRYLHWEEVRRRTPPAGLIVEQWWAGMWVSRKASGPSSI